MIQSYLPVVILLAIVVLFLAGSFLASSALAPKRRTMAKTAPYECGIVSDTELPSRFSVKFYLIAIAFIVVDVEVIFLYPFSTIFVDKVVNGVVVEGLGTPGLVVMGIFIGILIIPFAYLLASGALSFGPKTPSTSTLSSPLIRSQGFTRSEGDNSERDASAPSTVVSSPSGPDEPKVSSVSANTVDEADASSSESTENSKEGDA